MRSSRWILLVGFTVLGMSGVAAGRAQAQATVYHSVETARAERAMVGCFFSHPGDWGASCAEVAVTFGDVCAHDEKLSDAACERIVDNDALTVASAGR